CLLPDLYRRYRLYLGYLQGDTDFQSQIAQPLPNVDTLHDILHDAYPGDGTVLTSDQALLKHRLVVLDGGAFPVSAIPQVQVDSHIARFLLGDDGLDTRLNGIVTRLDKPERQFLPDDPISARVEQFRLWYHRWKAQRIQRATDFYRRWRVEETGIDEPDWIGTTVLLVGPYGVGKLAFAQAMCTGDAPLLVVQSAAALNSPLGWETVVDLVYREGRLHDAAVYWSGCERLLNSADDRFAPHWAYLMSAAETYPYLTFLASEVAWEPKGRFLDEHVFTRVNLPAPGYALRVTMWQHQLAAEPHASRSWTDAEVKELAERLASGFQFTAGQIEDAMRAARSIALERAPNQPVMTRDDVFTGCRRQVGRRLMSLARPFGADTKPTFADLLLPEATCRQLEELKQLVLKRKAILSERGIEERLSRGKGIVAMFTGTSGTGKTTAAEVVAGEAGVDLYKVDLSAVV
ncbi:MAG: AAA family ATPase, partial [Candidatus Methanoperedens sp.]|nr:AAA family ATPase [Candidatus Methanoperedens sp.]